MLSGSPVSKAATETGIAASEVLSAADGLSRQAEQLTNEVGSFVEDVRAAGGAICFSVGP
ncbi:hypothetical protein ACVWY3_001837 [Bradyrhizobium sp. USDA 4486]